MITLLIIKLTCLKSHISRHREPLIKKISDRKKYVNADMFIGLKMLIHSTTKLSMYFISLRH